jgi:uncharacterized membrane protein YqhA
MQFLTHRTLISPIAVAILMVNWKPTYFYHLWVIISNLKILSMASKSLLISYLDLIELPGGKALLIIKSISRRNDFISRIALKFQNVDIRTNSEKKQKCGKIR